MTPEEVLSHPSTVLSQAQREAYFEQGYVCVERVISDEWLTRLNRVTESFVGGSREVDASNEVYDLAPGHDSHRPRIRRLQHPDVRHPDYWAFATGLIADVAAAVVGPDVVFHNSKLNFKWNDGRDHVAWHQDICFYPHTNYSPLTIGVYLHDTGEDDGPLGFLPQSHEGPLFDHYDESGRWAGRLPDETVADLDLRRAVYSPAPAGSITVHNCRTVHGSQPSASPESRPLLLCSYTSADALPYTPHPDPRDHAYATVRGKPARWAHHDPRPCPMPPDWSKGYTSIFAHQAGEKS